MKTIFLLTIILVGTVLSYAQPVANLTFEPVPQVCGAPSDVYVHVTLEGASTSIINVDLILLDENNSPIGLVESRRVNSFGNATFLQVQPCQSYRVRPRVTRGEDFSFEPIHTIIEVQSGDPFFLDFVGTPIDKRF